VKGASDKVSQQPGVKYPVTPATGPRLDVGTIANQPWVPQTVKDSLNSSGTSNKSISSGDVLNVEKTIQDLFKSDRSTNIATPSNVVANSSVPTVENPNLMPVNPDSDDYFMDESALSEDLGDEYNWDEQYF